MNIREVPKTIAIISKSIMLLKRQVDENKETLTKIELKFKYNISIEINEDGKKTFPNEVSRNLEYENFKSNSKVVKELEASIYEDKLEIDTKYSEKEYYLNQLVVYQLKDNIEIEKFNKIFENGL